MTWLDSIIQGSLTGFGSAIGTYLAFKYGIDHIEKIPLAKDKVREYLAKLEKMNNGQKEVLGMQPPKE